MFPPFPQNIQPSGAPSPLNPSPLLDLRFASASSSCSQALPTLASCRHRGDRRNPSLRAPPRAARGFFLSRERFASFCVVGACFIWGWHHHCSHNPLLKVKKLSANAVLPSRASPLTAGYDLHSAEARVPAREMALVASNIGITIPEGRIGSRGN